MASTLFHPFFVWRGNIVEARWPLLALASFLVLAPVATRASSDIYRPLKLPLAQDVVAFANGVEDVFPRVLLTRERLLKFLARGKNNTDIEHWFNIEQAVGYNGKTSDGVFTDKAGKVYFWMLRGPKVLLIISEEHEQALVQLDR